MSDSDKTMNWILSDFDALQETEQASAELSRIQKEALKRFETLGLPRSSQEEWKYTNLAPLAKQQFALPKVVAKETIIDLPEIPYATTLDEVARCVFVNGRFVDHLSSIDELPKGLHISLLRDVYEDTLPPAVAEKARAHFSNCACFKEQSLVALNTAFSSEGVVVFVEAGVEIEKPVLIQFITTESEESVATYPRTLLVAEEGAKATVVEGFSGFSKSAYMTTSVTEAVVEDKAELFHYRLQFEGEQAYHLSTVEAHQGNESNFVTHCYNFGSKLARNEVRITANGEHSNSGLYGLNILEGHQHVDNTTTIDHAKPNCESDELYKGIYSGKSKGIFSGTIIVRPDAQKTNAIQSNQSIILSRDAESNSRPQLKIWADDVKCTHGATVGQLDEDALFYLRSRGIPKTEAQGLLLKAFAGEVLQHVELEGLREYLQNCVVGKL